MSENNTTNQKIAVILIRGTVEVRKSIKDTIKMLNMKNKNNCVVINKTSSNLGMIKKCKDFITWGEIDAETEKLLIEKRGEKTQDREGKEILKKTFRLHPPRKGFERKGIKKPFSIGGVLGYRGEKINNLIKKMI